MLHTYRATPNNTLYVFDGDIVSVQNMEEIRAINAGRAGIPFRVNFYGTALQRVITELCSLAVYLFYDGPFADTAAAALAQNPTVVSIDFLRNARFDDNDARLLAAGIPSMTELRFFSIESNLLTDAGADVLYTALTPSTRLDYVGIDGRLLTDRRRAMRFTLARPMPRVTMDRLSESVEDARDTAFDLMRGVGTRTALGRFLQRDGDNAITWRAFRMLLEMLLEE